jgi:hypothetical protein
MADLTRDGLCSPSPATQHDYPPHTNVRRARYNLSYRDVEELLAERGCGASGRCWGFRSG